MIDDVANGLVIKYCQHKSMRMKAITVSKWIEVGPCKKFLDMQHSK